MENTAKVVGMMQVDPRVQDAARQIIDDVVAVQGALFVCGLPRSGMEALRNIQLSARKMLTGTPVITEKTPDIVGDYRVDALEVLQGLSETLCCDQGRLNEDLSDEDLRLIGLTAEAAHARINNYLMVRRIENMMHRREIGVDAVQPAA